MSEEGRPYEDGTPANRRERIVQSRVDGVVDVVHRAHASGSYESAKGHQRAHDPANVGSSLIELKKNTY